MNHGRRLALFPPIDTGVRSAAAATPLLTRGLSFSDVGPPRDPMPGQSSGLPHIFPCTAGCTTTNPSFGLSLRGFSTSGSSSEGSHQTPPHLPRLHYRSPRGRKHPARVATAATANPEAGHPGVQARISVAPAGRSISREEQRRRPQASRCRLRSTRRTALYYSTLGSGIL